MIFCYVVQELCFFKCGGCYFKDVLNSSRLIQFLTMLMVKLVSQMNTKVAEVFNIFPTVHNTLLYLKYKFRSILLKWLLVSSGRFCVRYYYHDQDILMTFIESVYRMKVLYNTVLHDMVKFHNYQTNGLIDINIQPMAIRIQGRFHCLNSTEVQACLSLE